MQLVFLFKDLFFVSRHVTSCHIKKTLFVITVILLFLPGLKIHAQAIPAARKTGDLSVFALYNRLTPDYGPTNNNGIAFGVDYTRYTRWWVKPSIEFRGKIAHGSTVDESAFGGGIRAEKPLGRYHPYMNFLVSAGSIHYHLLNPPILPNGKPYTSDGTVTYSYGGGVDFDAWNNFAIKGDYQFERWHLDKYTPIDLSPNGWSVGVVYRIPFHAFTQ
jgi:hypothetical protein